MRNSVKNTIIFIVLHCQNSRICVYYVREFYMKMCTTGLGESAGIFAGPLTFIIMLFITALSVGFFLPQTVETGSTAEQIRTEQTWLSEGDADPLLLGKPIENALNPANLHTEINNKGKETDSGLEFYRQLITRNAVIEFYENITGNRDVALAILEYADIYDIPLSLAFSLAFNESRYKVRAVNGNSNASVDRGLFQLNSESFPGFTEDDFFNPYISAKQGLAFLRYCLDIGGNEISALAMYNAGTHRVRNNRTPQMTLNHISRIVTYKRGLEDMFNVKVTAVFRNRENKALAFIGK